MLARAVFREFSLGKRGLAITFHYDHFFITTLLCVLRADCLRGLRELLRDDRWIVTFALASRAFAQQLASDRIECIELFCYWQWDISLEDQERALQVGWATWSEYDDHAATDYTYVLEALGYYDSD